MIVKEVLSQVKPKRLFVAKYPVGLDSRLNDVYSLIRLESDDVRVFGIYGMGGSGITVIAKVLYNDIYRNFDLSCFIANVRDVSHQPNGLVRLQEQLISELVKGQEVKVDNVAIGIEMIRERFRLKKVLIILDDLDDLRQLDALAGHRDWFGGGSVIIITTRDQHLLTQVQVDGRYEANQLNKVDRNNELRMHDLLRDMGREIIREPFPKEPGKRSRLWSHQDVTNVLTRNMGTEAIEGVSIASPIKEEIHLNTMNFVRMQKLRLLHMDNVNLDGNFEHLSKVIKWISWQDCPLKHLPSNLQLEKLVALDMKHSKMSTIWHGNRVIFSWISRLWQGNQIQILGHLKILDLSHSKCLTSTPDFTRVPNLVTLILEDCTSLLQIDQSIGCLSSLLVLNLKGCEKITSIPSGVCCLKLLGYLNLSGCSNLQELPPYIGNIESLRDLYADETVITCLPPSLTYLRLLTSVSLRGCTEMSGNANALLSIALCTSMRRLNLRDCNLSDKDIPEDMGRYQFGLRELDLSGNRLSKLPSSFERLVNLESLWLDDWSILQSIPRLPPNLEALMAKNIRPLKRKAAGEPGVQEKY